MDFSQDHSVFLFILMVPRRFREQVDHLAERSQHRCLIFLRAATPRQNWEIMTAVSASHIVLTPTQPEESRSSVRGSNPDLLTRNCALYQLSCVDAVFCLLGVCHDFLYGDQLSYRIPRIIARADCNKRISTQFVKFDILTLFSPVFPLQMSH